MSPPATQPPAAGETFSTPEAVHRSLADQATEAVTGALDRPFWGNTVGQWITFGAVLAAACIVAWLVRVVIVARLKKWAERTSTRVDDFLVSLINDLRFAFVFPALLLLATRGLALPGHIDRIVYIAAVVGIAIQVIMSSRLLVDFGLKAMLNRHRGPDGQPDPTLVSSLGVLRAIAMVIVAIVVVLMALKNGLGIDVAPLLAGLGIGGIAIALAVQNLLGDLLGSLTILMDKPFVVGDSITVGDKSGTVERIGIKTTRVRATSGEQLVFANSDLLGSRLHNFKRMQERRVQFAIGVTYETAPDLLARVPQIIREAVTRQKNVRFDRSHLKTLNTSSVDFETVYFVTTSDYAQYMDVQQAINLELLRRFAAEGVEFAYPTQVAIQKTPTPPTISPEHAAKAG